MIIRTYGIGKLLYNKSQQKCITIWRCLSHRLQLAVRHCIADMMPLIMSRVRLTQHKPRSVNRQKHMNELKTVASTSRVQLTKIDSFNLPMDCKLFAIPSVWNGHLALLTHFKEAADNDEKTLDLSAHEFTDFLKNLTLTQDVLKN